MDLNASKMYHVCVVSQTDSKSWTRMFNNDLPIYKDLIFHFDRAPCEHSDLIVIFGVSSINFKTKLPKSHIWFMHGEPPEVETLSSNFLNQFGKFWAIGKFEKNSSFIDSNFAYPLHLGFIQLENKTNIIYNNLELRKSKSKFSEKISIVVSSKTDTPGHRSRLKFINQLVKLEPSLFQLFGRGGNEIHDKADALYPYKYTIVLENSHHNHYWTEKVSDAFVSECYIYYWGAPNLGNYFNQKSFTRIDLDKPNQVLEIMKNNLHDNLYEENYHHIIESKNRILDNYTLHNIIYNNFERIDYPKIESSTIIKPMGKRRLYSALRFINNIFARSM
jgi:hypothetical protein